MENNNASCRRFSPPAPHNPMENNNAAIANIPTATNPTRHPFSDLSNAAASSSSLPNRNPRPKPSHLQLRPDPAPHHLLTPSQTHILTTSRHFASSSSSGRGDCNLFNMSEQITVYRRKTSSRREHTTDVTSNAASSPPPRRTKTEVKKGKKSKNDDNNDTQRVISSAPCKRRKKPEKFTLPEDFVREQRDYFAKVDEEELIVEEAEREQFQFIEKSKDNVNQSGDG